MSVKLHVVARSFTANIEGEIFVKNEAKKKTQKPESYKTQKRVYTFEPEIEEKDIQACWRFGEKIRLKYEKRMYKKENLDVSLGAHAFTETEISTVRDSLLDWYDKNKRELPWRKKAVETVDINQRAYAVWVSEIMLQQTQVATVIDYYNKWMEKWPTLQDLAQASLEEVHTMWAGLGYYSRGKRLLEGAKKVVEELGGEMPRTAQSLLKTLPGVGRYTAGAIASIAYNQVTGIVDGNVVRVLSRLRRIGADSTSPAVIETLWSHANSLVDDIRPGDFNQSMMELGATVCTPKTPLCSQCPVRSQCKAYTQVELEKKLSSSHLVKTEHENIPDIECVVDQCKLCLPLTDKWDIGLGVMNYPRKPKKKAAREETTSVCLVCQCNGDVDQRQFLVLKRTGTGLLSGLWEFPSLKCGDLKCEEAEIWLQTHFSICLPTDTQLHHVGEVFHQFSHISQTYVIDCLIVKDILDVGDSGQLQWKWMSEDELMGSAISTAMKKVFKAFKNSGDKITVKSNKRKRDSMVGSNDGKKQTSLHSFFTPK